MAAFKEGSSLSLSNTTCLFVTRSVDHLDRSVVLGFRYSLVVLCIVVRGIIKCFMYRGL
jgi:hypothetical protein